jgi:hypothetical protein
MPVHHEAPSPDHEHAAIPVVGNERSRLSEAWLSQRARDFGIYVTGYCPGCPQGYFEFERRRLTGEVTTGSFGGAVYPSD